MDIEPTASSEKKPIRVTPGEPFSIKPNLDQIIRTYDDSITIDEILIEVSGVGSGLVRVYKDKTVFDNPSGSLYITPAGPIEVSAKLGDNEGLAGVVVTDDTAPLTVSVAVYNVSLAKLETMKCSLIFDNRAFDADTNADDLDLVLLEQTEGNTFMAYSTWTDRLTQVQVRPYFPLNDSTVFDRMEFIIQV